jgi:hypothetical protein
MNVKPNGIGGEQSECLFSDKSKLPKDGYLVKNCPSVLDDQLSVKIGEMGGIGGIGGIGGMAGIGGIGGMAGTGVIGPPRASLVKPMASPCLSLTYPSWN